MSSSPARRMNLIALALLITALIAFVAFHFLPVQADISAAMAGLEHEEIERGWTIWKEVWTVMKHPDPGDSTAMIGTSAFLTYTLLTISSPFLIFVLRISRVGWWLATLTSGMVLIGLGGIVVMNYIPLDPLDRPGPAVFCLLGAMLLNFLGLLFIRRELPAAPELDPA